VSGSAGMDLAVRERSHDFHAGHAAVTNVNVTCQIGPVRVWLLTDEPGAPIGPRTRSARFTTRARHYWRARCAAARVRSFDTPRQRFLSWPACPNTQTITALRLDAADSNYDDGHDVLMVNGQK
jgi:hypothetical protein